MSEEKEPKKRSVTELKFPLPDSHVSFDSQLAMISAYVVASNNGKSHVGYKELSSRIKVSSVYVSGCNKFFQHLGLIEPSDSSGKYKPTALAIELHNAKQWDKDELTKATLRKSLQNSWFWNQTKQYLQIYKKANSGELIQKLGIECGADPQKHKGAISKLIEYMRNAELIKEDDGHFILTDIDMQPSPISEGLQNSRYQIVSDVQNSPPNQNKISNQTRINFGVLINPESTEEQIRKAVRIVVDELEKIHTKKEESEDGTKQQ